MSVFSSGNIGLIFKLIEKNTTAGGKFIVFPLSVVNSKLPRREQKAHAL